MWCWKEVPDLIPDALQHSSPPIYFCSRFLASNKTCVLYFLPALQALFWTVQHPNLFPAFVTQVSVLLHWLAGLPSWAHGCHNLVSLLVGGPQTGVAPFIWGTFSLRSRQTRHAPLGG